MKLSVKGLLLASVFTVLLAVGCTKKQDSSDTSLYVSLTANVKGMDPVQADDRYSNIVINQIYEGLLGYHYLKRPLELVPVLAEAMPEVSKDGLTHTFKIRKGVKFQDDESFTGGQGREVTAEDFIYSWKRLADPANRSTGFWVFDGKIVGLNEWADAKEKGEADYTTPVAGLSAPDSHTLVIQLKEPYYQLHYVLAMGFTTVVPKEAVEFYGEEFLNHPVGTGPYKLEKWIRNSSITLVKNPTYRDVTYPAEGEAGDEEAGLLADAGKKLPLNDKVVLTEVLEDQPRWLNFQRGNLDFLGIPKDNFDSAVQQNQLTEEMKSKGIDLVITKEQDVTYTAFNMNDPVLGKNKKLRQAMSMAYDTDTVITQFYNGRAIVAHSPIPPDIDGYEESFKNPYKTFDVEKARALLKEAGFENGEGLPTFDFDTLSTTTSRQMAESFQQQMSQLGIKLNIRTNTWPQFQERIKKGQVQIYGIAWGADYPDAQNFLQLFYGKNLSPGPNGSNYQNPAFDKIYETSLKTPPGAARTKLYHQMRDMVVEDTPWIFATHRLGYYLHHGWLKNYKPQSIIGDQFKYLRVDGEERATRKASF